MSSRPSSVARSLIQWNPIFVESDGTNFRTHSLFVNDNWRVTDRITANVGIRFDRNDGKNGAGELVASQSAFSPRLGLVVDPMGNGRWSVTASAAKYVAGVLNSIADISSPGGNADEYRFVYRGPDVNVGSAPQGVERGSHSAGVRLVQRQRRGGSAHHRHTPSERHFAAGRWRFQLTICMGVRHRRQSPVGASGFSRRLCVP